MIRAAPPWTENATRDAPLFPAAGKGTALAALPAPGRAQVDVLLRGAYAKGADQGLKEIERARNAE